MILYKSLNFLRSFHARHGSAEGPDFGAAAAKSQATATIPAKIAAGQGRTLLRKTNPLPALNPPELR